MLVLNRDMIRGNRRNVLMEMNAQLQNDGPLRFVEPGKGMVATLSHLGLFVPDGLARRGTSATRTATRAQGQEAARAVETVMVHVRALTMAPGQRPAKELRPVIQQRLQLVTTSTCRQMPGLILVWPYAPMELTKQGQRLCSG